MNQFDEKDVMLAANAIGWIFFGSESEDGFMVEVSEEDSDKCITAARRALEHIEKRVDNKEVCGECLEYLDDKEQGCDACNGEVSTVE